MLRPVGTALPLGESGDDDSTRTRGVITPNWSRLHDSDSQVTNHVDVPCCNIAIALIDLCIAQFSLGLIALSACPLCDVLIRVRPVTAATTGNVYKETVSGQAEPNKFLLALLSCRETVAGRSYAPGFTSGTLPHARGVSACPVLIVSSSGQAGRKEGVPLVMHG